MFYVFMYMQNKLDSFNLDISHVIIFAKTCNWCFDTINVHSKKSMFFFSDFHIHIRPIT